MIPNNTKVVDVVNNFNGEKITMEIDPTATAHLMSLLTDLYSDPELACIREYSTNAWDAHLDAGNTSPIVVTTPNALSPYLTIQDFGVGMDGETIRKIYSQYGRSTKREQTTTNGSMGIGAKAALGYTNQFTVAGVKNGIKTLVSVSRAEDGTGVMEIVFEGKTDEPNGVTIQIPVKKHHDFQEKAEKFFMFWPAGHVLLNGKDPHVDLRMISSRIGILPEDDFDNDIVFMGNVPYPLDDDKHRISSSYASQPVVFFSTMNASDEVVFTPSREGLIYNGITVNALAGAREEYNKAIQTYYSDAITNAATYGEAYRLNIEAKNKHRHAKLVLPDDWKGTPLKNEVLLKGIQWHTGRSRNAVSSFSPLWADAMFGKDDADVRIVTNYSPVSVSSDNKNRIRSYFMNKTGRPFKSSRYYGGTEIFLISGDLPSDVRFVGANAVKWETIQQETRAERKARAVSSKPAFSYAGKYDVYDPISNTSSIESLNKGDKVIYWAISKKVYNKPEGAVKRNLHRIYPGYKFVFAAANRHEKLERDFDAKKYSYHEAEKIWAGIIFEDLTQDQIFHHVVRNFYDRQHLGLPYWNTEAGDFVRALDNCLDKEYARVVKTFLSSVDAIPSLAQEDPRFAPACKAVRDTLETIDVQKTYPLVNEASVKTAPVALVEYINHEYNKKNGVI